MLEQSVMQQHPDQSAAYLLQFLFMTNICMRMSKASQLAEGHFLDFKVLL